MQEFDITIVDKPGKANVVADFLSWLYILDDPATIDDSFPDEHLFLLATQNPWYADIANYLTTKKSWYTNIANYLTIGKMHIYFFAQTRKLLVDKSFNYSWIAGFLFYTGPNQIIRRCLR